MSAHNDYALRLMATQPKLCEEIARLMEKQRGLSIRTSTSMSMTPKMKELADYIMAYSKANDGIFPSFDEMKDAMGLVSKSGIHRLVLSLEERGIITRLPHRARAIVVNESELIAGGRNAGGNDGSGLATAVI